MLPQYLSIIMLGLLVGGVAKVIIPGRVAAGWLASMFAGVSGALVAGWFAYQRGWFEDGQTTGLLASLIGAILVVTLYRKMRWKSHASR